MALETAKVPLLYFCISKVALNVSLVSDLVQVMLGSGLAPSAEQVSVNVVSSRQRMISRSSCVSVFSIAMLVGGTAIVKL